MKLTLRRVELATPGAEHTRRAWPTRRSLLLRLTDPRGVSGVGEASPLPGYSADALETVELALTALDADAVARAVETEDVRAALSAVAALLPAALPSARFALESAALDLLARRRGVSAPALLGAALGARRPLARLLGPADSPALLASAEQALGEGYRCFKLKVGAPHAWPRELASAAALREQLGDTVALRLDANGALSASEVSLHQAELRALRLDLFEEPGAALPEGVPLALDESLQGHEPDAAERLWQQRGARAIVLKPTALGGISHAFALADRARRSATAVVLSHCFDGPIAWRAAAALALTLPEGVAHGLAPHPALSGWPHSPLPVVQGSLHVWAEPGLGYPPELAFP